jgi:hypothetical protein
MIVAPTAPRAQETGKPRRIGYLSVGGGYRLGVQYRIDAFLQGLRELGWIDGRSVVVKLRWVTFDRVIELARLKVEVIVTGSDGAIRADAVIE